MATSCTHAVKEDAGEYSRDRAEIAVSSHGTLSCVSRLATSTTTAPERLVPPTPLPATTLGEPSGYGRVPTMVYMLALSPGKPIRSLALGVLAATALI